MGEPEADDFGQLEMDLLSCDGPQRPTPPRRGRFDNRWRWPGRTLTITAPPEILQRPCARFAEGTLDPEVGRETYLVVSVTANDADQLVAENGLYTRLATPFVETEAGAMMCLLVVLGGPPPRVIVGTYMNPYAASALRLFERAACQTRIKLIVYDVDRGRPAVFIEIRNLAGLAETARKLAQMQEDPEPCDFARAMELARERYTVPDLYALAQRERYTG